MVPRNSTPDAPRVQLPGADADRPSWTRVGVIAAIGFVVGVAWPRLAGVRLGPSVPEAVASASAPALPSPSVSPSAAPPAPSATATASDRPASSPPTAQPTRPAEVPVTTTAPAAGGASLAVGHGVVTSCKSASGDSLKGADCGALAGLDAIVVPRLRKLAECSGAAGTTGKVRFGVRADFARNVLSVDLGHGTPPANADALLACARSELRGASLASIAHENARYNVAYALTFAASGGATDDEPAASAPAVAVVAPAPEATGEVAQVAWKVALVRDAPKTGKVVAQLPRGTTLHAGAASDGWIPVKYGDNFASDGWVYHGAIGR
jgi:hypothetical protein